MAARNNQTLTHHLRRIVLRVDGGGMTDGQLLETFISRRDAAAFEALVRRHGPMVLGVCRRILRDPHDSDDAFQATFLVLARKAASVSPRERVGNFLYGVAHTTALRARSANAKRRSRERQMLNLPEREAAPNDRQDELHERLDHELARLPDKYRLPIVLCDLEGRTRREVARQLKIPEGTLSSRLTTARKMLAKRLTWHGLAVSGGGLAAALSPSATSACVPLSLVSSTVKAATFAAAGQAATGIISGQVAALTQGVLKAMFLTKLKTIVGVMLVVASMCGAAGLIYQTQAAEPRNAINATEKADQEKPSAAKKIKRREKPKPDKEPKPADDRVAIRGVWRVISVQHGKEEDPHEEATRWKESRCIFDKYCMEIRSQGAMVGLTYKLDPSRSPKLLELKLLGRTIPAIYALEGDVLQIRMGLHETTFPKALSTKDAGNKTMLLILKRETPKRKASKTTEKANKEDRPEPKKMEETASSKSTESMGYIKITIGPQPYRALFIKMLGVIAEDFEHINYANQYDGRIEAYKIVPATSRTAVQHAFVRFETHDDGYLITVRINKVRMSGTESEQIVGRNTELEQRILKKLKAQQVRKDSLPPATPPARPKTLEKKDY
ncbi:MAG TPA: sigma-70 family RNA polymerase sigma factor [Gemmataceae bacterium]|nr:sigma-70 family RNA polymerase sigma factor [Gemmataceae bacterium]